MSPAGLLTRGRADFEPSHRALVRLLQRLEKADRLRLAEGGRPLVGKHLLRSRLGRAAEEIAQALAQRRGGSSVKLALLVAQPNFDPAGLGVVVGSIPDICGDPPGESNPRRAA